MGKGIAVRTILLLVVGVLTVGILVYLVYETSSTSGFTVSECRSELTNICNFCMNMDWKDIDLSANQKDIVSECSGYAEFFYWNNNQCCENTDPCGLMKNDCKAMGMPV